MCSVGGLRDNTKAMAIGVGGAAVVIAGPTGIGKSALAVELARCIGGEVISADSVQVYKGLDIGSNKISTPDQKGVEHHLLNAISPKEHFSAGKFYDRATALCREIQGRGKVPIICGGTTMYIDWFVKGKPFGLPSSTLAGRVRAEKQIEEWREERYREYAGADAKRLASEMNDWYRLTRALEISLEILASDPSARETGSTVGIREKPEIPSKCFCLWPSSRQALYRRLDYRCEAMISPRFLTEAARLIDNKIGEGAKEMAAKAVGYRHAMDFLQKARMSPRELLTENDLREFIVNMQRDTRRLAKQQLMRFRQDYNYRLIEFSLDPPEGSSWPGDKIERCVRRIEMTLQAGSQTDTSIEAEQRDRLLRIEREESRILKTYVPRLLLFENSAESNKILRWVHAFQQGCDAAECGCEDHHNSRNLSSPQF